MYESIWRIKKLHNSHLYLTVINVIEGVPLLGQNAIITEEDLSQASTTPKSWSHVEKELDHTALGVGVAGVAATGSISCWVWLVLVVCCWILAISSMTNHPNDAHPESPWISWCHFDQIYCLAHQWSRRSFLSRCTWMKKVVYLFQVSIHGALPLSSHGSKTPLHWIGRHNWWRSRCKQNEREPWW